MGKIPLDPSQKSQSFLPPKHLKTKVRGHAEANDLWMRTARYLFETFLWAKLAAIGNVVE